MTATPDYSAIEAEMIAIGITRLTRWELYVEISRLRAALEFISAMRGMTLIAPSLGDDCDKAHQLGANKAFEQVADTAHDALQGLDS
jgi:hypothetical protein